MLDWILTTNGFILEALLLVAILIYVGTRICPLMPDTLSLITMNNSHETH